MRIVVARTGDSVVLNPEHVRAVENAGNGLTAVVFQECSYETRERLEDVVVEWRRSLAERESARANALAEEFLPLVDDLRADLRALRDALRAAEQTFAGLVKDPMTPDEPARDDECPF